MVSPEGQSFLVQVKLRRVAVGESPVCSGVCEPEPRPSLRVHVGTQLHHLLVKLDEQLRR